LLVRFRMHLTLPARSGRQRLVAEEAQAMAFTGRGEAMRWLDREEVNALLAAEPSGNVAPDLARDDLLRTIEGLGELDEHLAAEAHRRVELLRDTHLRVRTASRQTAGESRLQVTAHTPVDILGAYVYLPAVAVGGTR
jgi:hypothetical protein